MKGKLSPRTSHDPDPSRGSVDRADRGSTVRVGDSHARHTVTNDKHSLQIDGASAVAGSNIHW
ncbi:MAG: hypothetical protein JWN00_710 [Actinomycetia bacterium]|nr:hypothetical protein [Actinomycetes bacterium]